MRSASEGLLYEALGESQRLGFLGDRPISEVVEHARMFVRALDEMPDHCSVIDLGAGGGVPGLVIAHDRPDFFVTLLDRRRKRTDFLQRIVGRLGWADRVRVLPEDAEDAVRRLSGTFDGVVARGFGPPVPTLTLARRFTRPGGLIIISEPPSGDRWDTALLEELGVRRDPVATPPDRVARFRRLHDGST